MSAKASGVLDATDASASWRAETSGPNWKTETTYEMLRWDDLILQDHTRSMLSRLGAAFVTLGDWLVTGTLFRFFYASWKYAGFFLFSYLWIAGFAASGAAVGYGLTWLLGMTGAAAWIAGAIVAAAVFTALCAPSRLAQADQSCVRRLDFLAAVCSWPAAEDDGARR